MYATRPFLILVSAALALGAAAPCRGDEASGPGVAMLTGTVAASQSTPAVTPALGRLQVLDPVPSLFAGAEASGSALGAMAAPSGTLAELAAMHPQEAQAQRVSRRTAQPEGSVEAPRRSPPSGWMAFLTGLAVVVFVAYRKLSLGA
jgi:hypothetical protein